MTKLLRVCLLAVPFLWVSTRAEAHCPPWHVDAGAYFKITCGNNQCGFGLPMAGPWYTYFPYDAYFQTPAPYAFPFWPASAETTGVYPGMNSAPAVPGAPVPVPESQNQPNHGMQPVGYYPDPPSYWYGK